MSSNQVPSIQSDHTNYNTYVPNENLYNQETLNRLERLINLKNRQHPMKELTYSEDRDVSKLASDLNEIGKNFEKYYPSNDGIRSVLKRLENCHITDVSLDYREQTLSFPKYIKVCINDFFSNFTNFEKASTRFEVAYR